MRNKDYFLTFCRWTSYFNAVTKNVSSVDGYIPNLCGSGSCKKKNSPVVPLIVASVGALFVLSLIVGAILLKRRRRRKRGTTKG